MLAISTHAYRVLDIHQKTLVAQPGVVWRILVQDAPSDPHVRAHLEALAAGRNDVCVIHLAGRGVAANRNAALDQAIAEAVDILLFGDDDMSFFTQIYPEICAAFAADPALDFLCGRLVDAQGRPHKAYNQDRTPVSIFNCAKVGTPELALRVPAFTKSRIRFETAIGAGGALYFGEEFIFLSDALRAGHRGAHRAFILGEHPPESSGLTRTPEAARIRKQIFQRALGPVRGRIFHGLWQLREYARKLQAKLR